MAAKKAKKPSGENIPEAMRKTSATKLRLTPYARKKLEAITAAWNAASRDMHPHGDFWTMSMVVEHALAALEDDKSRWPSLRKK
jgi:hypothetical protein